MTDPLAAGGQFIHLKSLADCADLRAHGGRLPSWQEVREKYPHFIRPAPHYMRHRLFITHRWDDKAHPDPRGWQLAALREMGEHYHFREDQTCIWYDYMSLPQRPHTPEEKKLFSAGLDSIRATVSACENVTLVSVDGPDTHADLAAMRHRGWIVFELLLARRAFRIPLPIHERYESQRIKRGRDAQHDRNAVVPDLNQLMPFESWRLILRWFELHQIVCTNGSDLTRLAKLFHRELTEKKHAKPDFQVTFGTEMLLTYEQLSTLEIMETSGLSGCYPRIFLEQRRNAPGRDHSAPLAWLCTFAKRPEMPPLEEWSDVDKASLADMKIDRATLRSPMYPGIQFELDSGQAKLRPTLRDLDSVRDEMG